ncbi:DUF4007 family protein [Benzoatithermus flavus]|uniref:DUF4007 family protein n=1 Tax=Benzoatithermus flavus TaxID=3108223 RepID=A0ABU8XSY9_9PROT
MGLRDAFETAVRAAVPDVIVNGAPAGRAGNTSNPRFPDIAGQASLASPVPRSIMARVGGHETFVRPGRLTKGLRLVVEESETSFEALKTADALGVGQNMAKAIGISCR